MSASQFIRTVFLPLLLVPLAGSAGEVVIVAKSGDRAPGGDGVFSRDDFFSTAAAPVINDQGQVAFVAELENAAGANPEPVGLYFYDPSQSQVVQLARQGQPAPGGDGLYAGWFEHASINEGGEVAFRCSVLGVGVPGWVGLFKAGPEGASAIAVTGQAVFTSTGDPTGTVFTEFGPPTISDTGDVAFFGVAGEPWGSGVFLGNDSELQTLSYDGDPFSEALTYRHRHTDVGRPVINSAGEVAVFVDLVDGPGPLVQKPSLLVHSAGAFNSVLKQGASLPGGDGSFGAVSPVGPLDFNDHGELVFQGEGHATTAYTGIFRVSGSSGSVVERFRMGGPILSGGSAVESIHAVSLNNKGEILAHAETPEGEQVLLFSGGGVPTEMAWTGSGPDNGDEVFAAFEAPQLNGSGQAVFLARLEDGGDGIYRVGGDGGIERVIRTGDIFAGGSVASLVLAQAEVRQSSALDGAGRIAFGYTLASGRGGVAVSHPESVPVPGFGIEYIAFAGSAVEVAFPSRSGCLYQLQRKMDLADDHWIDEGEAAAGTGGQMVLKHAGAVAFEAQFYRVVEFGQ